MKKIDYATRLLARIRASSNPPLRRWITILAIGASGEAGATTECIEALTGDERVASFLSDLINNHGLVRREFPSGGIRYHLTGQGQELLASLLNPSTPVRG